MEGCILATIDYLSPYYIVPSYKFWRVAAIIGSTKLRECCLWNWANADDWGAKMTPTSPPVRCPSRDYARY